MISKFCVFGERCSGTTYLENLIESNFELEKTDEFGLKHLWNLTDFADSDTTLFVGIERELLEWLDSFAKTPHQVVPYCPFDYDTLFFKPIRSFWKYKVVDDYKNIIEMREIKSQMIRYLIPQLVENFIFTEYNELVADPIHFLETIQKKYNLTPKLQPFKNWDTYKNKKEPYFKKPITIPLEIVERLQQTYPKHFLKEGVSIKMVIHSSLYSA